jgi:hypothetical protein
VEMLVVISAGITFAGALLCRAGRTVSIVRLHTKNFPITRHITVVR